MAYMLLEVSRFVDFMAYWLSVISFQMTLLLFCNGLVDDFTIIPKIHLHKLLLKLLASLNPIGLFLAIFLHNLDLFYLVDIWSREYLSRSV